MGGACAGGACVVCCWVLAAVAACGLTGGAAGPGAGAALPPGFDFQGKGVGSDARSTMLATLGATLVSTAGEMVWEPSLLMRALSRSGLRLVGYAAAEDAAFPVDGAANEKA